MHEPHLQKIDNQRLSIIFSLLSYPTSIKIYYVLTSLVVFT